MWIIIKYHSFVARRIKFSSPKAGRIGMERPGKLFLGKP